MLRDTNTIFFWNAVFVLQEHQLEALRGGRDAAPTWEALAPSTHVSLDITGPWPYATELLYPVALMCRGTARSSPYRLTSRSALPKWLQAAEWHLTSHTRSIKYSSSMYCHLECHDAIDTGPACPLRNNLHHMPGSGQAHQSDFPVLLVSTGCIVSFRYLCEVA